MVLSTEKNYAVEFETAENYINDKEYANAAALLIPIVEGDATNWKALNLLGVVSWKQEEWYDAFTLFKTACEIDSSDADLVANLFDISLKLRRLDEVLYLFYKARDAQPENGELAEIVTAIEEDGDDVYNCGRALEEGYYHPELEKADILTRDGEYSKATLIYLDFLEKFGDIAEAYNGLAVIAFYNKNLEDALSLAVQAIKQNPINRDMHFNLADIAKDSNKTDYAYKVFQACKDNYPQLTSIEAELLEIYK